MSARKCRYWFGTLLLALLAGGRAAGEPRSDCEPQGTLLERIHPAGGWFPYGGGLLRWWDPHCFPRCGGPDDYCRKNLPDVCLPAYPPWYTWGPPAGCAAPPAGNAPCTPEPGVPWPGR